MKWLVVLALVSAFLLVGCGDDQPSFLIVQGAGISNYNITNNITNNVTTNIINNITNNITNNLSQSINNSSFACEDANSYIYNSSIINGVLTGVCAADSVGAGSSDGNNYTTSIAFTGTTTKTLTLSRSGMNDLTADFSDLNTDTNDTTIVNFHTSQINGLYTNDTLRLLTTNFQTQNTSYFNTFWKITDAQTQNITVWNAINGKLTITDFQTQNTSVWTTINNKLTATANTCISNQRSWFNGTGFECGTDETGSGVGGSDGTGGWVNTTTTTKTSNLQVNISNGNLTIEGTGTIFKNGYPSIDGSPDYYDPISIEFWSGNGNTFGEIIGAAISSGGTASYTGTAKHMGAVALRDSATANGGYYFRTEASSMLIGGGERARFIFLHSTGRPTQQYRLGWMDNAVGTAEPTDGCFFNMTGNTTVGKCINNNAKTATSTTYTLSINTWYDARIDINDDATYVNFSIYDDSNSLLWTDNVSTNIPKTTGRETGFGVIATESTTNAAANIVVMDFVGLRIKKSSGRAIWI